MSRSAIRPSHQATHKPLPRAGATKPLQLEGTSAYPGNPSAAHKRSWREVLPTFGLQCGATIKPPQVITPEGASVVPAVRCLKSDCSLGTVLMPWSRAPGGLIAPDFAGRASRPLIHMFGLLRLLRFAGCAHPARR